MGNVGKMAKTVLVGGKKENNGCGKPQRADGGSKPHHR